MEINKGDQFAEKAEAMIVDRVEGNTVWFTSGTWLSIRQLERYYEKVKSRPPEPEGESEQVAIVCQECSKREHCDKSLAACTFENNNLNNCFILKNIKPGSPR